MYQSFEHSNKSNSVAHLVENEAPLSTTGNVSILSGGGAGGPEDTTTTTILLDEDGMELETRGMGGGPSMDDASNQLTGSYTNLFRDSMANGTNGPNGNNQPGKSSYHHSSMMMSECDKIQSADEIINVSELMMVCSVSGHENVYSNVPPAQISPSGSAVGLLSPKRASVGSSNVSGVDVSSSIVVGTGGYQHVYSNVTSPCGPTGAEQLATVGTSTGTGVVNACQQPQHHALGNGGPHHSHHHNHHHHHQLALDDPTQLLSSTFISNDLDLDDPVLSSSFATATKTTANTMTKMHPPPPLSSAASVPMHHGGALAQQQHLKQPQTMITTIEMKNVIKTLDPNVIIHQQTSNGASGPAPIGTGASSANISVSSANVIESNGGIAQSSHHTESPMFISPSASRMRLLQESTMIDTALDLDSLDGSIGNHSQSCLVKTAIV
uniref:Uncharacterized protein n=1 Tax=Anopheles christyi TaxID=43041 RepID=A0A182KEQ5_9DIPT